MPPTSRRARSAGSSCPTGYLSASTPPGLAAKICTDRKTMTDFYDRHSATLAKAMDACDKRYSWTAYPESPSSKIHGEEPPRAGKARFEAMLGSHYPLQQPGEIGRTGAEVSPYTGKPLGISYPK